MKMPYASLLFTVALCLLSRAPAVFGGDAPEWKRTSVEGLAVMYQDVGPKEGQTLLFIHGWACDATFWLEQVAAFSDRYRCIALDLPGFGRSDKPGDVAYSLGLFAKAVKAVADDAGAKKPVLVGHSMGFAAARQFLIDNPGEARAAVNVDGALLYLPDNPMQRPAVIAMLRQYAESFSGPQREAVVDEFVEGIFYGKTPENIREVVRRAMTAVDPHVCGSSMAEFVKPEWWTKPHTFALPCLALYAENPMENPGLEANLRREFPDMTFIQWNDTGHFLMMEKPARFNAALRDFLDALEQ